MNLGGVIHLNKAGICIVCGCIFILFLYVFSKNGYQNTQKNSVNLKDILKVSVSAAESGGMEVVLTHDIKIESKGKTKEGANDSVTTADFNSHCAMIALLKHSFSNVNVISEEKTSCEHYQKLANKSTNIGGFEALEDFFVNSWDITVWIDPLDATQEYTERLTNYVTTMVCVAVKGEPVIGVIHKPFSKETYWAWVENGKSSNLINTMPEKEEQTKFIISRSHSGKIRDLIKHNFADSSVIEAGGAGYKVLEIIKGNADVYIHSTAIKKWDICAGNAILRGVGGKMTTLYGNHIMYGSELGVENAKGLIATMRDHERYLQKL